MTEQDAHLTMQTFQDIAQRVVAISSMDVYRAVNRIRGVEPGPPDPVPLAEVAPVREKLYLDPNDNYEKILVERVVMGNPALPGTILRLPQVYGPGDPQHRIFHFLKRMDDGRPAIVLEEGYARWRTSRGYVDNVGAAIALAVTNARAAGRIYNVADAVAHSMAERAHLIGQAAGWTGQVLVLPKDRLPAHLVLDMNTDQHWVVDTTRIRQELGYAEVVSLEEGLKRTIAWERAHPAADPAAVGAMLDYAAEDAVLGELRQHGS